MQVARRNAVKGMAIATAGAAAVSLGSAFAAKPAVADEATADYTCDLLIVGGGLAGMAAGLQAQEEGIEPLIIDKAGDIALFSNSSISGGSFATPMEDTEEAIQDYIADFNTKSKGKGSAEITETIARNVTETVAWLGTKGCEFAEPVENKPFRALKIYAYPAIFQGMRPLMIALQEAYEGNGGQKLVQTKLIDLVIDETGAVAGAKVRTPEGIKTVSAGATIIATGGYVGNRQLLEQYVGPDADEILLRGHKTMTGDGLLAAERAGAMLYQMGGEPSLHIAAVSPQNVASGNPSNAIGFCISIDVATGTRFTDESLGYVSHGKALMNRQGQTAALVFDSKILEENSNVQIVTDQFANLDIPVATADTLEELAEQIGVDPATFVATIDEYNAATDGDKTSGLEVEKTALAFPVEEPPFYAITPLQPGCIMGFGGLYCDADGRVLEADGTPIENLYVAGEAMGGVFMYDYMAGASLARASVYGRITAKNAAAKLRG